MKYQSKIHFFKIALFYISMLLVYGCTDNSETGTKNTIKVGVLFSQTGDRAVSEASLKDAVLMAIEEINNDGGLLGKQIEPIALDPESGDNSYYFQTNQLLTKHNAPVIFGAWSFNYRTSLRKALEKNSGLFFYPLNYEGDEFSERVVCVGATPNQQIKPAVDYLLKSGERKYNKFYLLGNNSAYSHKANRIIRTQLLENDIPNESITERDLSIDQSNITQIVNDIKQFSINGKCCVINSTQGESSLALYKEFTNQGLSSSSCPIMNLSIGEEEFTKLNSEFLTGHLFAKNYFQSVESEKNIGFVSSYKLYCAINELPGGIDRVTSDGICWAYTSVMLWKKAVEKAQSFDTKKVKAALNDLKFNSPAGMVQMHTSNLHLAKPIFIGESKSDGQIEVLWKSDSLVQPVIFYTNQNNRNQPMVNRDKSPVRGG